MKGERLKRMSVDCFESHVLSGAAVLAAQSKDLCILKS